MRNFKATTGPFRERPFYTQEEIEQICVDELRAVDLLPKDPSPIRIERFIEKKYKISHQYEDVPVDVLGFSLFGPKGVEKIVLARLLEKELTVSSGRRIRTTLAHEVGHVLLQGHLFALGKKPKGLFDDGIDDPKILCREYNESSDGSRGYDGKWWEVQANLVIGPILMPKMLVEKTIEGLFTLKGSFSQKILEGNQRTVAIGLLSNKFNVNPAAARTRINVLYPLTTSKQLTL